jgi:hypothetical protein
MDADAMRDDDDDVINSANCQNAHGALLDGNLVEQAEHVSIVTVVEIITELQSITARGRWMGQKQYDETNGGDLNGQHMFDTCPMQVHNKLGYWQDVQDVPNWPLGVARIQHHYINYEWGNLADVLDSFVRIAKATLRTKAGVAAYFSGQGVVS